MCPFAGIMCLESLCGSQFREDRITDNEPTYAIRYETGKSDLTQELKLYAQGAVLLDADSGRVLYGKNETIPMAMASTTKIMTCILVLEMQRWMKPSASLPMQPPCLR